MGWLVVRKLQNDQLGLSFKTVFDVLDDRLQVFLVENAQVELFVLFSMLLVGLFVLLVFLLLLFVGFFVIFMGLKPNFFL